VQHIIVGSEALAAGLVTRQALRTKYVKLHHNVYAARGQKLDPHDRAIAAWLWSGRRAVVVGHSAAALLGTKWLPDDIPAELVYPHLKRSKGITIHRDRIADDEVRSLGNVKCTTAVRTAYDIGRRVDGDDAIVRIDALLNRTRIPISAVETIAGRYPGARGIRQLRAALDLVDGGAESPKETELRLLLVREGLPRPVTQIRVGKRRVDMGWPLCKVGVEYDGEQHFTNARDYADDIERLEYLAAQGWTIIRVSARQLRFDRAGILARVRRALAQ
jgi:very-short-patch-repair endonuclease